MPLAVQVKTQLPSRTTERRRGQRGLPSRVPRQSEMPHVTTQWATLSKNRTTITGRWSLPAGCLCNSHSRSCRSTGATGSGFDSTGSTAGRTAGGGSKRFGIVDVSIGQWVSMHCSPPPFNNTLACTFSHNLR